MLFWWCAVAPVAEALRAISSDSDRAHHHHMVAWGALVGRGPDPSTAYRESVRAVEVAAKPAISPANSNATLGTIIKEIRAKPTKWSVEIEKGTPEQIASMAELISGGGA